MNKESFITLNIYYNEKVGNILINHYPIIFYWNGEDDIIENMKSNKDFFDYLSKNCFNIDLYPITKISFVQFNLKNGEEEFDQKDIILQDLFNLSEIPNIYEDSVINIITKLYYNAFKKEKNFDKDIDYLEKIKVIYKEIQEQYKDRFTLNTFINYVRSRLIKEYKLNQNNTEILIEKIVEYIK